MKKEYQKPFAQIFHLKNLSILNKFSRVDIEDASLEDDWDLEEDELTN